MREGPVTENSPEERYLLNIEYKLSAQLRRTNIFFFRAFFTRVLTAAPDAFTHTFPDLFYARKKYFLSILSTCSIPFCSDTVCPRSFGPLLYSNLHEMDQDFLDIQYILIHKVI